MSNFFFKGTDINNIIDTTGSTVVSNNYIGFPKSSEPVYPIIERPLEINFTDFSSTYIPTYNSYTNITKNDLSNRCKINPFTYNANVVGVNASFNVTIPNTAKYISGYCVGGGGGGGGAGGAGNDGFGKSNKGGTGGTGASGNYSAIVQYPLIKDASGNLTYKTIAISVGAGGLGGEGGAEGSNNNSNSGKSGNSGYNGGNSYITFNDSTGAICTAPGGGAGNYGGSGNSNSSGGSGKAGIQTAGNVIAGGKHSTTIYDSLYPPYNMATGGTGGNAGNGSGNNGIDGGNGLVVLYFLYD
jgi:hypothetical protein